MGQQRRWTDEFVVGGRQLAGVLAKLVSGGNLRRLIVMKPSGRILFQTTVTTGLTVAGVFTVLAPTLTAICALTALVTNVRVKIIYHRPVQGKERPHR